MILIKSREANRSSSMSLRGSAGVRRSRYRMLLKKRLVVSSTAAQPISTLQMKLENLLCMVAGVCSNDSNMQEESSILIRKLLCLEGSGLPIEEVIQYGAEPLFYGVLREHFLQLQQTTTSDNILSIFYLNHVVVPNFVKHLATLQRTYGRDRTVCWLGNLVGWYRDRILSHMNKDAKLSMLRNDTLALLIFCQGYHPTFELLVTKESVFGVLEGLVADSSDQEVLTNTCCALLYLSSNADNIEAIIEAGLCQRLVDLLQHPSPCVVVPALVTVANIVTHFDDLLKNKVQVTKTRLMSPLLDLDIPVELDAPLLELDIEKEFGLAISKANKEEIKLLVKRGCVKPLCDLLYSRDSRLVSVSLQGLDKVLEDHSIDEAHGFDKIRNLQSHHNHEISHKALKIVKAANLKIKAPVDPINMTVYMLVHIPTWVYEHKYEEAFTAALETHDVGIVSWLCSQVDLQEILTSDPAPLSQGVLQSLLQQLACDIGNDTSRKLGWMMDIVVAIKRSDGIYEE